MAQHFLQRAFIDPKKVKKSSTSTSIPTVFLDLLYGWEGGTFVVVPIDRLLDQPKDTK